MPVNKANNLGGIAHSTISPMHVSLTLHSTPALHLQKFLHTPLALHNCSGMWRSWRARMTSAFYGGNSLLMNTELVCSTTHLNQETTRHSAARTDENTLCNAVAEWETEEIIWTCVWKASEEHSAASHSVLSWASVKTCHFQKKRTSYLKEIPIKT